MVMEGGVLMHKIISMQDIRESLASIANQAQRGERFVVIRHSRPAFQIVPIEEAGSAQAGSDEGGKDWLDQFFELADRVKWGSGGRRWRREDLYRV